MEKNGEYGLILAATYLDDITPFTNSLPLDVFFGLYCMLAEEYCRFNGFGIHDFITKVSDAVVMINEELGEY